MSITKEKKAELIKEHAQHEGDTGSVEVQCAILSVRITALTAHLKSNMKDFSTRRGLLVLVSRRRHLLNYLKRNDEKRYQAIVEKLGLRK